MKNHNLNFALLIKNYKYKRKMFRTLGDYKKDEKEDKKKSTSYTGGEKSGMAVENPSDLDVIVEKAR